ncbi:TetR/AcrR family transcriptional regulator [bacterium]|nr:TetR/AcrR family transcriptional regulator [bacterium]
MPKVVDKEAKKLEILNAAIKVFAKNGMVKTKMAEIAQAAGIGKGTIYEYYRSKEEIFHEAFIQIYADMHESVSKALKETDDPIEKIKLLINTYLDKFDESEDFVEIMMDFWAEGVRNKNADVLKIINLNQIYTHHRNLISEILEDGIRKGVFRQRNTKLTASVLLGAFDGLFLQWIIDRSIFNLHEVADELLDGFLNGIKKSA